MAHGSLIENATYKKGMKTEWAHQRWQLDHFCNMSPRSTYIPKQDCKQPKEKRPISHPTAVGEKFQDTYLDGLSMFTAWWYSSRKLSMMDQVLGTTAVGSLSTLHLSGVLPHASISTCLMWNCANAWAYLRNRKADYCIQLCGLVSVYTKRSQLLVVAMTLRINSSSDFASLLCQLPN